MPIRVSFQLALVLPSEVNRITLCVFREHVPVADETVLVCVLVSWRRRRLRGGFSEESFVHDEVAAREIVVQPRHRIRCRRRRRRRGEMRQRSPKSRRRSSRGQHATRGQRRHYYVCRVLAYVF